MQTNREYKNDRIDSDYAFNQIVKPIIDDKWGCNHVLTNNIKQDVENGIDGYIINNNNKLPFSNRVQPSNNYKSFTIRLDRIYNEKKIDKYLIEYHKIKKLIILNKLYPYYFIQSYIKNNQLLSSACIETIDLWSYIFKNWDSIKEIETTDKNCTAKAKVIYWDELRSIKSFKLIEC